MIDALVNEDHESLQDDGAQTVQTKSSAVSSSIFSSATPLYVFDDGSVTTAGRKKPFIVVQKRCTPAPLPRKRALRQDVRGSSNTSSSSQQSRRRPRIVTRSNDCIVRHLDEHIMHDLSPSWTEFQRQSSGDIDEMVDEAVAALRLSEHVLSFEPKKREMVDL